MTAAPTVSPRTQQFTEKTAWDKAQPFVGLFGISLLAAYIAYVFKLHLDLVTGLALITLLFMMLQTEHERCDRVRAGWREVRKATLAATTAIQWAGKKLGQPDAETYGNAARTAITELYATILLYGQGSFK